MGNIKRKKYLQHGYFEKHILCKDCDNNTLGILDRYAASILKFAPFTGKHQTPEIEDDKMVEGFDYELDYAKFKLFFLSVLWRAHISSNFFFSGINIPDYSETLRSMILNNDVGDDRKFPINIIRVNNVNHEPVCIVSPPLIQETKNQKVAGFFIGGISYTIELTEIETSTGYTDYRLRDTGVITVPVLTGKKAGLWLKEIGFSPILIACAMNLARYLYDD